MAVGVLTSVVIFDEHLYPRTGMVGRWMTRLTTRFTAEAIRAAPMDTGELKAGISGNVNQVGLKMVQGTIESSANHTMFVIRGTGFPVKGHGGRIYTTKGFGTRNPEDAYVELWGVQGASGKFSRKGKGKRRKIMVRRAGYWLKLPFRSSGGGPVFAHSVRGQEPNNFMFVAWRRTARAHPAIRGLSVPGGLS